MIATRSPDEVEWSAALDAYEAMLQFHVQNLESGDAGELRSFGALPTPPMPMPSSLVARAMELLERTGELEGTAKALQVQVQLELVPQRAPLTNDTLPTLLDRRI